MEYYTFDIMFDVQYTFSDNVSSQFPFFNILSIDLSPYNSLHSLFYYRFTKDCFHLPPCSSLSSASRKFYKTTFPIMSPKIQLHLSCSKYKYHFSSDILKHFLVDIRYAHDKLVDVLPNHIFFSSGLIHICG